MKIYIDESGDLGFTQKASPCFVIAALIVHDSLAIRRCFAKVRRNKLKKKYWELPEFKVNNSGPEIRKRILSCIASADVLYMIAVLAAGVFSSCGCGGSRFVVWWAGVGCKVSGGSWSR